MCDQRPAESHAAVGILIFQINGFWLRQMILLGSRFVFEAPKRGSLQKKAALQNDSPGNPLPRSVSVYFVPLSLLIHGRLRRKEERSSSAVYVLGEELSRISWGNKAAVPARRTHSPMQPHLALPFPSCVTLCSLLHLAEPQFSQLSYGGVIAFPHSG